MMKFPMWTRRIARQALQTKLSRCKRGFSMVELMTVMGIMAILAAVSVPAISSLLESNSIAQGGQVVASQLSLARQIAASRNCTVEVRLYSNSSNSGASPYYYNAIQLWAALPPNPTPAAIGRLTLLPQGAVISSNATTLSPMLTPILTALGSSGIAAKVAGQSVLYVSLRISPTGLVSPATAFNQQYFTVVPLRSATATAAPKNYVTVQVNPTTGTQLIYRP